MVIEITDGQLYQKKEMVLKDINFTLGKEEFAYLIGKTGSGKSSLLKCVYGEVSLGQGTGESGWF